MRKSFFVSVVSFLLAANAFASPGEFSPPKSPNDAYVVSTATLSVTANIENVQMIYAIGNPPRISTCNLPCSLALPAGAPFSMRFSVPLGYNYQGGVAPAGPRWKCGLLRKSCVLSADKLALDFVTHEVSP